MTPNLPSPPPTTAARSAARWALAALLLTTGAGHLSFARRTFRAQVPRFVPLDEDAVVTASGGVELTLAAGLLLLPRDRVRVGRLIALFFAAVFPGNLAQFVHHRDGFGLNTDTTRFARLLAQPGLMAWAWWSTAAPTAR